MVAAFDGGAVSSDGGALLLGKVGAAIGLVDGIAKCFLVARPPALIEHSVRTLVGQRVFALALGYEDVNDYEQPRHDSVLGKLYARVRMGCAALADKSTLSRLGVLSHARRESLP